MLLESVFAYTLSRSRINLD